MATTASGKLSNRDFATLEALVMFSRSIADTATTLMGDMAEPLKILATELDGVPIAVRDIEHGRQYQVTAVSNATLSDAYFNSYGRFQKQAMPDLFR